MGGPLTLRCAEGNGRIWTLKQVQGDDDGNVAFRSISDLRHPGPDPGARFSRHRPVSVSSGTRIRSGVTMKYPPVFDLPARKKASRRPRSEEHTSELQSLMRTSYAVFGLKKKKNN